MISWMMSFTKGGPVTFLLLLLLAHLCRSLAGGLPTELPYQCTPDGHHVLGNPFRSTSYAATARSGKLCDRTLDRGWYRFQIYGKYAEMPTECVQVGQCGTDAPLWLDIGGRSHPPPGESSRHVACAAWSLGAQRSLQDCCLYSFPVTITNCVDFFVYHLLPARGCNMAYCAVEGREKCLPGQISLDGFAPCRENFPDILDQPTVDPVILEDVLLKCSFHGADLGETSLRGYTVTWYKADSTNSYQKVSSMDTYDDFVLVRPRDYFRMGDKIICSVQAFFNETRAVKSPAVDSDPFEATIKVSPERLDILENGQPHFLVFESSVPITCADVDNACSIRVALTSINNEMYLGSDVVLSECFLEFRSRVCLEPRCRRASVLVTAVTDFTRDGSRDSVIVTGAITSKDPFWNGFDPPDVEVSVQDVRTAQCYAFTEPHFITFDRKKYDFYKTGTYILVKSRVREFEVHQRIWSCGESVDSVSCGCGFVAREDNDIVSVDMCNGVVFETAAVVKIRSPLPLSEGVRVKKARNGTKITVEFPSGAFVRADIADWGMSITVQAPSVDFNQTQGLCGNFDGVPENDFQNAQGQPMNVVMRNRQANEFVEQWRLRDGGMFNLVPSPVPFRLQLPSCSCSLFTLAADNALFPSQDSDCLDSINCVARCTRNEGVSREDIIRSLDITAMYSNVVTSPWHQRVRRVDDGGSAEIALAEIQREDGKGHKVITRSADVLKFDEPSQYGDYGPELPLFLMEEGHLDFGAPLIDTYFFYADHAPIDLEPVVAKWPTATNITEQQALTICERTIRNSSLGLACGTNTLKTDMFIQDAMEVCLGDILMTDDIFWSLYAIPLLENQCEAAVVADWSLWNMDIGQIQMDLAPPENVVEALNCPKNCSGNGICSKLVCVCAAGFSSHDCSRSTADVPELLRLENNGLCDWRSRNCRLVRVMAKEFQAGRTMDCYFTQVQNSGVNATILQSKASYINRRSTLCHLPPETYNRDEKSLTRWEIKVSYEESTLSSGLVFIIYDSHCQQCDWMGFCQMKKRSCLIDSKCYQHGEINPDDQCLQCVPAKSVDSWSPNTENKPPVPENTPLLTFFVDELVRYQITAKDPEGSSISYRITSQDNVSGVNLASDGTFTWLGTQEGDYSFAMVVSDACGASSLSDLQVRVVQCGCRNGGLCMQPTIVGQRDTDVSNQAGLPRYVCSCPPRYSGTLCEVSLDGCSSSPCIHGHCMEVNAVFSCQCEEGYAGSTCSTPTNPCLNQPCYPGVSCQPDTNFETLFTCGDCPSGFSGNGITCEEIPKSRCGWGCPRRMKCDPSQGCVCQDGYAGYRCHYAICIPSCRNNGYCVRPNECVCPLGYSGPACETAQCIPACQNGGRCVFPNMCSCIYGYLGPQCQILTCTLNCANGGYCITPDTCKCLPGYTGPKCEQAVCQPACQNGGTCVRPGSCVCLHGFQGEQCQTAICSPSCRNGGTCVRPNMCACPRGYNGAICAVAICEPRCLNGGRCVKPNKCSCPSGYRGRKCHKAICVSGCRNGGECIKPNICMCKPGYTGSNCQTPVCRRPCMYGGRCVGADICQCRAGYTGANCQEKTRHARFKRGSNEQRRS